jgi:uncharacterized membrane protein YukC
VKNERRNLAGMVMNRKTMAAIGVVIVAIIVIASVAYIYFFKKPSGTEE